MPDKAIVRETPSRKEQLGLAALFVGLLVFVYYGWHLFWFLTDDAYIAFRYISNSILGYGYVWNPLPFRPVEGYTSFLWVVLLDVIWRLFDVEPPDAANYASLVFSYLTLFLGAVMVLSMNLDKQFRRYRVFFSGLVFVGVVSNRTFLAWTSSGLETAIFNFFLTLWILCSLFLPAYSRAWLVGITSATVLAYLTRPDGILIALTTTCLVGIAWYAKARRSQLASGDLTAILPLLAIPAHLAWRRAVYGEWLPNTYYAKVPFGRIWPESGMRYFLSFVIEYSLWIWLILLIVLIFMRLKQPGPRFSRLLLLDVGFGQVVFKPGRKINDMPAGHSKSIRLGWGIGAIALCGIVMWISGQPLWGLCLIGLAVTSVLLLGILNLSLIEVAVVVTLLVHFLYYTVVIGGDHFEFRVYSHLILLLFVSFIWILNAIRINIRASVLLLVLFIVLSWPVQWTHWVITHNLTTREETKFLKASVADAIEDGFPAVPAFLIDYLRFYDSVQFWLIDHAVCMRHQEHKVFHLCQMYECPSREEGMLLPNDDYPVILSQSVGVTSWGLPKINVIDVLGLNDYVIARNPDLHPGRLMAHERRAPPGYLECFSPNVVLSGREVVINRRTVDLTAEKITECEQRYAVGGGFPLHEPTLDSSLQLLFDQAFVLRRIQVAEEHVNPGEPLYVRLIWEAQANVSVDYRFQFDLLNITDGRRWTLASGLQPVQGTKPTSHWRRGERIVDAHPLRVPHDISAGSYLLRLIVTREKEAPFISDPVGEPVGYVVAGPITIGEGPVTAREPTHPVNATFANNIRLMGYDLDGIASDDSLSVTLYWQAADSVPGDYTVFVHLLSPESELVTQHDSPPLLPTSLWIPGTQVIDAHTLVLPADLSPGEYQIRVGLYHWPDMERVPIVASSGLDETNSTLLLGYVPLKNSQAPDG